MHINIKSLRDHFTQVRNTIITSNIDVLSLAETWMTPYLPTTMCSIPGYKLIRHDRGLRATANKRKRKHDRKCKNKYMQGGGVGCYIRNTIPHRVLHAPQITTLNETESLLLELGRGNHLLLLFAQTALIIEPCCQTVVIMSESEAILSQLQSLMRTDALATTLHQTNAKIDLFSAALSDQAVRLSAMALELADVKRRLTTASPGTEFLVFELHLDRQKLLLISVYRPPDGRVLNGLFEFYQSVCHKYSHVVMVGDFNVDMRAEIQEYHTTKLGSHIEQCSLDLIPSEPTNHDSEAETWIDLAISTPFHSFPTTPNLPFISWHDYFFFDYSIAAAVPTTRTYLTRNLSHIDYGLVNEQLGNALASHQLSDDSQNDADEYFNNVVIGLLDAHARRTCNAVLLGLEDLIDELEDDARFTPHSTMSLTGEDLKKFSQSFLKNHATLLSMIATERAMEKNKKIQTAVNLMCKGFFGVVCAYISKLAYFDLANDFKEVLAATCKNINQATTALKMEATKTQSAKLNVESTCCCLSQRSYARATSDEAPKCDIVNAVSVTCGRPISIKKSSRITVRPRESEKANMHDAPAVKAAFVRSVNPAKLGGHVKRVHYGRGVMVVIEGEGLGADTFIACPELAAAGLEVKPSSLLHVCLIMHSVPVQLTGDEIGECMKQDMPGTSPIKIVYLYPAGNKKQRSCMIKVSVDTRKLLLSRERVNLRWHSCCIEDHFSIMQCFKCSVFSHIAARCDKEPCYAYCAGEHLSKACNKKSQLKCINCVSAGLSDYSHSGKDKNRCILLRQKTNTINYG
ncbi:hypothetical protein TKK_0000179 [Trichogramma kaykai]